LLQFLYLTTPAVIQRQGVSIDACRSGVTIHTWPPRTVPISFSLVISL
jgi:hypothetical protein